MKKSRPAAKLVPVVLLLIIVAGGSVSAVSVNESTATSEAEVGSTVVANYTLEELYTNYTPWTLEGDTGLEPKTGTWTVITFNADGEQIDQHRYNSSSFAHEIAKSDGVNRVTVRVEGTVPADIQWSYKPAQSLSLVSFEQSVGGERKSLYTDDIQPYHQRSRSARTALDEAKNAIEDLYTRGIEKNETALRESNWTQAKVMWTDAETSFNAGNFENAEKIASQAEAVAESVEITTTEGESHSKTEKTETEAPSSSIGVTLLAMFGTAVLAQRHRR